ncbi:ABC transporter permease [Microtetraspora sp. NBRC 13810]|uniref:ABC transporter permease n=1 Tax=Microtetraspora sp. NBRC 13810 TaxID=3030990 RepID=UPI0024A01208|nr:ABC transporter permease [Microtetraspora sp. NBRC 13810]GLW08668.1 ABC transporter permease [Microtetraspora sp. NBRC 13810]
MTPLSAAAKTPADAPSEAGRDAWAPLPRRGVRPRAMAGGAMAGGLSGRAKWGLRAASVAIPLAAWLAVGGAGVVDPAFLPSPAAVWAAFLEMAGNGQLASDALASLGRVGAGFGLAVLISVPLGVFMGTSPAGQAFFEPVIGLLRYMPASAFIPLLIIWLGLGEPSKVAILVIGVVFFNTLMTADVVRQVPGELRQVAATLGATGWETVRKVIWPHSVPGVLDAMRVNAAAAWNFVVVAELIAAESGLGYRIVRAQRFLQTDTIFAVLVVIGCIGLLIDVLLRVLRDRAGRWSR